MSGLLAEGHERVMFCHFCRSSRWPGLSMGLGEAATSVPPYGLTKPTNPLAARTLRHACRRHAWCALELACCRAAVRQAAEGEDRLGRQLRPNDPSQQLLLAAREQVRSRRACCSLGGAGLPEIPGVDVPLLLIALLMLAHSACLLSVSFRHVTPRTPHLCCAQLRAYQLQQADMAADLEKRMAGALHLWEAGPGLTASSQRLLLHWIQAAPASECPATPCTQLTSHTGHMLNSAHLRTAAAGQGAAAVSSKLDAGLAAITAFVERQREQQVRWGDGGWAGAVRSSCLAAGHSHLITSDAAADLLLTPTHPRIHPPLLPSRPAAPAL